MGRQRTSDSDTLIGDIFGWALGAAWVYILLRALIAIVA
jgi:hypothetical protein